MPRHHGSRRTAPRPSALSPVLVLLVVLLAGLLVKLLERGVRWDLPLPLEALLGFLLVLGVCAVAEYRNWLRFAASQAARADAASPADEGDAGGGAGP